MEWKIKSAESLQTLANQATKPWYRKPEFWIGIIANIIALGALVVATLAYFKN